MKRILMFVFIGCLVMILGFPRPAFADRLDGVLASLNQNHQAIGKLVPDIHTLQIPPLNQMLSSPGKPICDNRGLSDRTIFSNASPGQYGCVNLYDWIFYADPQRHIKDDSLRLSGPPTSENQVVDIPKAFSSPYRGRYFTRQYPEFAILGASVADAPYRLQVWEHLNPQYDRAYITSQSVQVDRNAVIWQKIPSTASGLPWVHQLLIVENNSTSNIGFGPSNPIVDKQIPKISVASDRSANGPGRVNFPDFYYILFGSYSDKIDQNTIKTIVQGIITGVIPQYPPVRNPSFKLPKLTRLTQTNLPINVSDAFTDRDQDRLYYQIRVTNLPSGLKFDATKNEISFDTSNGQPYGPGPNTAGKWLIPITVYDYDPKNPNSLPNHKNHTVTENFELEIQ